MSVSDFDGKVIHPKPMDSCASCMFGTISCGTAFLCPSSIGARMVVREDGTAIMKDNYCACPSRALEPTDSFRPDVQL